MNPVGSLHRPASQKAAPTFRDASHRADSAAAFRRGADVYDDVRPSYPPEVAMLIDDCSRVADIGAGTGKLTSTLLRPTRTVFASDPSADMTRVLAASFPSLGVWRATAENTALRSSRVDALTCAQTWHWVDTAAASAEADRVIAPGGKLLLVWNTLDVSHPWILRLARIMRSGDIQREGFYPEVSAPWVLHDELRMRWIQHLTTDQVYALSQTRSSWLRASEEVRERMKENLRWYLFDRLEFQPGQLLPIPYRTEAFVYKRD
ncbi:class I SAM-dependent methyltransferase [Corynebacterium lubricantis]|uniref:class I SAM-dependent methyltransferase n=1 Tax=Corynebacterium lubricantis TaxID=541095 RepID=UPI00037F4694|nr:class I SAM-dependent methyltransferase [Corynebacterium lubricantis]